MMCISGLQNFCEHNYTDTPLGLHNPLLPADIFEFFRRTKWYRQETYEMFVRLSSIVIGHTFMYRPSKLLYYNTVPASREAREFHEQPHTRHNRPLLLQRKCESPKDIDTPKEDEQIPNNNYKVEEHKENEEIRIKKENKMKKEHEDNITDHKNKKDN